jgi:glutathione S-transferase
MKLYYLPGACSMAAHIILREAGYAFEIDKVDPATQVTAAGEDYKTVNARGYVPALRLDSGEVLTEDAVILQYLADQKPEAALAPPAGTMERYRLMEWLNFIATELHKNLGALFNPKITAEWKAHQIESFSHRAGWLDGQMTDRPYIMGTQFSVADAYLFTVLSWCAHLGIALDRWPALKKHQALIAARPAVIATIQAEH